MFLKLKKYFLFIFVVSFTKAEDLLDKVYQKAKDNSSIIEKDFSTGNADTAEIIRNII
jgi:hypothetical protein